MRDEPRHLLERLSLRADRAPDALAYDANGETVTWGALERDSRALAARLRREGLGRGDRCALLLPTGLDFIRALFAVQWLGATPIALDRSLPPPTLEARLALMRCRLALTADAPPGHGPLAPGALQAPRWLARSELSDCPAPLPRDEVRLEPDDIAYIQLTSGTTGAPKGAMVSHRSLDASLRHAVTYLGLTERDRLVSWLPLHHDFGLVRFVFAPVYVGCPTYLLPPSILHLERWLRTLDAVRGTLTGSPDFGYKIAARLIDPAGLDLSSLRLATSGGEPVRASTIRAFEERFGVPGRIKPAYGMAEVTLTASCDLSAEAPRVSPSGDVSCGPAVPGVEVQVVDATGAALPFGVIGAIRVRGDTLFSGYFDDPEATAEVLRDGWLYPGDLGALDAEGHLYVLGRERALIKRAGAMISPREVEEAADAVPGLRFSAAIGLINEALFGTEDVAVVAEVRPQDVQGQAAHQRLAEDVATRVAAAIGARPWRVLLVVPGTIPRTANGKIRHALLRARVASGELTHEAILHDRIE